jgi:diguanylate cyclase (GGDEF)-like protein
MTLRETLQTRSLRFWIMAGMLLALAPVVTAAVAGFILLDRGVIASFQDLANRERTEIVPAQRIGLTLWDTAIAVDEFVEDHDPARQAAFRSGRTGIEADLAALLARVRTEPAAGALVTQALEDWRAADKLGLELVSVLRPPGDPAVIEMMDRFDGAIRSASDRLEAAIEHLEADIDQDQDAAALAYERALWLAGIAAGVCLLTIVAGVVLIGRVMAASVDRLVDGAIRFSEGDRTHRIDVRVPPELRRVAGEFNRMIGKIHAYEDVLSERALKDVLTGLSNRRAFEESMERHWDRMRTSGEPFAMLQMDIDHFKRVNDTYGHTAGDEVLRRVAETITRQLRAAHPVFRTGGEEFSVLIPNAELAEAMVIAERLRAAVAVVAVPVADREISVTISIGVADSRGLGGPDDMIRAADAALYRAKSQGRNRIAVAGGDVPRAGQHAA